jgi:hypothetical protein
MLGAKINIEEKKGTSKYSVSSRVVGGTSIGWIINFYLKCHSKKNDCC